MLRLKLELIMSSCEKSANGVQGTVSGCAENLHKSVSWVRF